MKELLRMWGRVAGRTYSAVGQHHEQGNNSVKTKTGRSKIKRFILFLISSVACLGVGLFIMFADPYNAIFNWKITFGMGGEIYELWRKPEVDLYLKIYLFNITNSKEFMNGDEPMKLQQVGPYVYRELLEHGNVTFNDNATLSSVPIHPLRWVPEMSYPNTENDTLVLPNIAMLSIGHVASTGNAFTRLAVNTLLRSMSSKPLIAMTAKDFMFGYKTPLVTLGNRFLPGWIKFDKVGLIDRMYDFEGDFETVYTGSDGRPELAGLIDTWRGARNLPHWKGSCGNIHMSSDGAKYPGNLQPGQEVLFYRKSLCRAAPMVKTSEGWIDGLWGHLYTFHKDALDNGQRDEKNKCFCRKGRCLTDGLIDVTDCYYGFPIALSYPHFLNGDPRLQDRIQGLMPTVEDHGSLVWLQPRSGLPLRVAARFQINMALTEDMSSMYDLEAFSKFTLPLLWFEIGMYGLPDSMANRFKLYLNFLPKATQALMWISLILAPAFLLLAFCCRRGSKSSTSHRASYNPKRRPSRYAESIRKMSQDLEAKLQGVYGPCEIPLDGNESSSPFLHSVDMNTSDSDETDHSPSDERRPSLIKTQTDKIKDMGISLGNRIQGNIDDLAQNIKNFTNRLGGEVEVDSEDANNNEGFNSNSDSCQSSGEDDKAEQAEDCEMEIVDDGCEFDAPFDANKRRRSEEFARLERKMTLLETGSQMPESERREILSRLPYLPEEQV